MPSCWAQIDHEGLQVAVSTGLQVISREDEIEKNPVEKSYTDPRTAVEPVGTFPWPASSASVIPTAEKRLICGLRWTTFLLVCVLIFVVIGAAVGGGIGGTIAVQNAKSQGASTTASSSGLAPNPTQSNNISTAITIPTTGTLPFDCPALTGTTQSIVFNGVTSTFQMTCGIDNGSYTGPKVDMGGFIAYSLRDCLAACVSHNMNLENTGQGSCQGATFLADLTTGISSFLGTCFLKNDSSQHEVVGPPSSNLYAGAILATSGS